MKEIFVSEVLERLKKVLKIKTDTDLNDKLELNKNTISIWKHRNTLDYLALIAFCNNDNININYILTGDGEPYIENVESLKNKIKELEETIKKIDILEGQDNKNLASLDAEVRDLRSKLAYADELIFKLANR
ncbi:MAG TPA: helix-turn-helix domain-containing protein [Candidatus Kapabacteria bacterium]|nr:helix-turn-helix domain-containing protein [Candidatus Kapabacteria bacterium]